MTMSDIDDIIEGLFHVGVLATAYKIGQESQKSLSAASERNDIWGMLSSAVICGAAMYGSQWSARNLRRLIRKNRIFSTHDLQDNGSLKKPTMRLLKGRL